MNRWTSLTHAVSPSGLFCLLFHLVPVQLYMDCLHGHKNFAASKWCVDVHGHFSWQSYIMWTVYWPSWNADGQSIFWALVYLKAWVYFFFHAPTSSWKSLTHTKCQQVNLFCLNIHFVSAVLYAACPYRHKNWAAHIVQTHLNCVMRTIMKLKWKNSLGLSTIIIEKT